MRHLLSVATVLLMAFSAAPAHAEPTLADLQLAARALSFLEKPMTGNVRLGIVYIPGDSHSTQDADSLAKLLGSGLKVGNLTLTPVLVPIGEAARAPVDAFFLSNGMGDQARLIAAATAAKKVPCITLDLMQVQNGSCVLGIQAQPKVQIYVSRAAAADSDTQFVSVFRMMVTEF